MHLSHSLNSSLCHKVLKLFLSLLLLFSISLEENLHKSDYSLDKYSRQVGDSCPKKHAHLLDHDFKLVDESEVLVQADGAERRLDCLHAHFFRGESDWLK